MSLLLENLLKVLKNIFLSKYYTWFENCDFPISIIPKFYYKSLIDIESLLRSQTIYVIRRSDMSSEDTFNELGVLRNDAIKPREIPFLSLNILGGNFKVDHSKFRILNKGIERWRNREIISIADFLEDYTILDDYSLVYIEANGVNGQVIPYNQNYTKELKKEVDKFFQFVEKPKIIDESHYLFKGETKLLHDPINLNYWHMELNVFDFKGEAIKYKKSKYIENFCNKVITDIICANSFQELPEISEIPKKLYRESFF